MNTTISKDMLSSWLFNIDSYKTGQFLQDPENFTAASGYIEGRSAWREYGITDIVFAGLQPLFIDYPLTITKKEVELAAIIYEQHGVSFNANGFMRIVNELNGKLPIAIYALPEGAVTKPGVPLVRIESTHEDFAWIVRFVETALLRSVWYMSTVASLSRAVRIKFSEYFDKTSDEMIDNVMKVSAIDFKLHDFGSRGTTSREASRLGGIAHLISFKGSDTVDGLLGAMYYYDADMPGFSIDASEHSTVTIRGRYGESDFLKQHITNSGKNGIIASVIDSYNAYDIVDNVIGVELKEFIINSGKTLVLRPDSGDPTDMVKYVLNSLWNSFGGTINSKGFKVLHPSVRVIQGDGVNFKSIFKVLDAIVSEGYSIDNIAFGMGGKLLQSVSRDDFAFANKLSYAKVNNKDVDVYKDPITDKGKTSKKGKVFVELINGEYVYTNKKPNDDQLKLVYKDGVLLKRYTFDEVRQQSIGGNI